MEKLKLKAVLVLARKLAPVVLGAVGGFVASTYPGTFAAFCGGGM
ncbi:hypothetical protein [Roseovarius amoyensis]|nr:hypothetical protein [Roseovarius amoyensis]